MLDRAVRLRRPGPYQLQAAIAAGHARAPAAEATDWQDIVLLYDRLRQLAPTPVVLLTAPSRSRWPTALLPAWRSWTSSSRRAR